MLRLNLLRYFDKSFSQIYQIEHGEIAPESDDIVSEHETTDVVNEKTKSYNKKYLKIAAIVMTFLFLITSGVAFFFYYKIKQLEKEIAQRQVQQKVNHEPKIKPIPKDNQHGDDINKDKINEEDIDFVKIGTIQFLEENPIDNEEKKVANIKEENNKTVVKDTKKDHKNDTGVQNVIFQLVIDKIYQGEIDRLKKYLSDFKVSYQSVSKGKEKLTVYKAYRYVNRSNVYLGDKPVELLAIFYNKEEAINFLRGILQKGVITSKVEEVEVYEIIISSFKSETEVSNFIEKTKLKDKKYEIKNLRY
ncbi:MAG: hypothetical protein K6348_10120 [Deferribacterales bacterium]